MFPLLEDGTYEKPASSLPAFLLKELKSSAQKRTSRSLPGSKLAYTISYLCECWQIIPEMQNQDSAAGSPYLQIWILCFHQPVWKIFVWGGWISICAQHVQTFFCHYWINKAVCNNYVPSICVMVCVRSNLELTKVFRRICVGYLSTIKERLEHLRIWVSKMDLWTNPPVDRKGERHSSCRMVVWDNMWTLT